ncbi:MAG: type IV pilin protein [Burkholderiaceae bacterium]
MRRNKGFTLIELMIVVAIIAILSAIAIPSYSDYVRRSKITDAVATLAGMRVKMEQYFQDNRTYVGACTAGTVATLPPASAYFTFDCGTPTAATYTITATGTASMLGFGYSLDQANARATTAVPTGWTLSNTCWVLKKDGSC